MKIVDSKNNNFDDKPKNDRWRDIYESDKKERKPKTRRCPNSILNPDTTSQNIPIVRLNKSHF